MIYILTGIAKAGKTLLANEILNTYQIPSFSTDYIMMMLHRGNPDLKIAIDAEDSKVAKQLEPYVYGMIQTMIENNETYLIEGVHFNPDFSKRLLMDYPHDIKILYIGYKDISVEHKVQELQKNKKTMNNPWIFDHNDESLEKIVAYLITESLRVSNECAKYQLPYVDVYDIIHQKSEILKTFFNQNKKI